MTGDPIPAEDHVVRHCEKRFLFDGKFIGPGNFQLRKSEECLSVNWLEKYGAGTVAERLVALQKHFGER